MKTVIPFILALASLAAGAAGLYLLIVGRILEPFACHLAAAAMGYRAALISDRRRLGEHWFQFTLSFCMPFLGPAATFFLSEAMKKKKTGNLAEEFAVYLNDAASFRESVPVTDDDAPESSQIIPLADILAHPNSEAEQRIAVEYLVSMETPAAMDILRNVMEYDSGEGRFFAMTALAQMEDKMLAKLQGLEEDLASGRDESPATMMETARTYMDFSYYRLAQDERRAEYLARAWELLERVMADPDADVETLILLGRVALLSGDAKEAMRHFDAYIEKRPDRPGGYLWRAEAWFALRNFEKLRESCRQALAFPNTPSMIRDTASFWVEVTEAEPQKRPAISSIRKNVKRQATPGEFTVRKATVRQGRTS